MVTRKRTTPPTTSKAEAEVSPTTDLTETPKRARRGTASAFSTPATATRGAAEKDVATQKRTKEEHDAIDLTDETPPRSTRSSRTSSSSATSRPSTHTPHVSPPSLTNPVATVTAPSSPATEGTGNKKMSATTSASKEASSSSLASPANPTKRTSDYPHQRQVGSASAATLPDLIDIDDVHANAGPSSALLHRGSSDAKSATAASSDRKEALAAAVDLTNEPKAFSQLSESEKKIARQKEQERIAQRYGGNSNASATGTSSSASNSAEVIRNGRGPVSATTTARPGGNKNVPASMMKRLQKELAELTLDPITGVATEIVNDNLSTWRATIAGPSGSPYENGQFKLNITFPENYPFKAPLIKFETKIYHCNISPEGSICLDILKVVFIVRRPNHVQRLKLLNEMHRVNGHPP